MVDVPAVSPVTNPVVLTVATAVFEDNQGLIAAAVPLPVNWVVVPGQADNVPDMVGNALMVTTAVFAHPLVLVYVIVDVLALTPVTSPVTSIVATPVLEEDHGLVTAAVALPDNCVVFPIQADNVPVIVGTALIVTVAVMEHPLVLVYVILAEPADTPVTNPVASTVATPIAEKVHGLVSAAVALPVNCVVLPTQADNVPVMVGKGLLV